LDLGPPSAYAWLARNSRRFGFIKGYAWEPWHYEKF
jgi:LAS superfamily LD-carboxypeptidase LdcB